VEAYDGVVRETARFRMMGIKYGRIGKDDLLRRVIEDLDRVRSLENGLLRAFTDTILTEPHQQRMKEAGASDDLEGTHT